MAMAAAANKAVAGMSFSFLRQSFGLLRNLSAAASPPQATAAGDAEQTKRKKKKKKNLFDVVQFLPKWGIGYKVAKSHWRDVSYEITKINLYKVSSSPFSRTLYVILLNNIELCFFFMWDLSGNFILWKGLSH
jgi:hypothetical protein